MKLSVPLKFGVRRVGDGAAGVDGDGAVGRLGDRGDGQGVAVSASVSLASTVDRRCTGGVLGRGGGVVDGDRGVVDRR